MNTFSKRKVLVTGGAGFIGSHLVRRLVALGSEVVSLGGSRSEGDLAQGAHYIFGDLSRDTLETVDFVPRAVFHLAGGSSVSESIRNPPEDFLKSVFSSIVLLDFLRTNWPEATLVFVSSAAIYGEAKEKKAHHDLACLPVSPYGVHKKQVESLLLDHARMYGTQSVIVRPFSVYGPGLRKQLLWDAMEKTGRGVFEFAGSGDEQRDWVYVGDLVECLLRMSEFASTDVPVANAGICRGISVREVLTELFRAADIPRAPVFIGNRREGDPERLVADDSAEAFLGPLFVTKLSEGLAHYVHWYRAARHG
jgi:UDP-glucose 4-epimerase